MRPTQLDFNPPIKCPCSQHPSEQMMEGKLTGLCLHRRAAHFNWPTCSAVEAMRAFAWLLRSVIGEMESKRLPRTSKASVKFSWTSTIPGACSKHEMCYMWRALDSDQVKERGTSTRMTGRGLNQCNAAFTA